MTIQQALGILLGLNLAVVGLVDLWLQITRGREATITSVVRDTASAYPLLPFAIGLVMGHLLWCDCRPKETPTNGIPSNVIKGQKEKSSEKLP